MPTTYDYRRANLRKLAEQTGGVNSLGKLLGYTNSSFIVQMIGPNPIRQVSESTARKFETTLDLIPGSLDQASELVEVDSSDSVAIKARQVNLYRKSKGLEPVSIPVPQQQSNMMSREQLAELVALVGKVCNESGAQMPTGKFADIIALTLLAKDDKNSPVSEDYVRMLVSLTK